MAGGQPGFVVERHHVLVGAGSLCAGLGVLIIVIAGTELAVMGGKGLDPQKHFRRLDTDCRIVRAYYHLDQFTSKTGRGSTCTDVYTYEFTHQREPGAETHNYRSGEEVHGSRKCYGGAAPPALQAGTDVPCWEPANVLGVRERSHEYNCGNPQCVKVQDPASHVHAERGAHLLPIAAGVAAVLAGSCMLGEAVRVSAWWRNRRSSVSKSAEQV